MADGYLKKKMAKAWIELYPSNGLVTDWYIRSIGSVLADLGFSIEYTNDCSKIGDIRHDLYFVSVAKSAAILTFKGCRHLIYWAQGIAPEEDYLRFNSKPRKIAFDVCEKLTLKCAKRVFAVSGAMLHHFEGKYGLRLEEKTFIAPCSNEVMHKDSFFTKGKYEHPVFTYAGGLSKYQCIDRMLDLFGRVQEVIPDSELLFYTWDVDKACELVSKRGLTNVTVESKKQDELPEALARAKYGFVIRDDIAVNHVATPTKISTYMSNGIIPVVSDCIEDFAEASRELEYVICCVEDAMVAAIRDMEYRCIEANAVCTEFSGFFDEYFDLDRKRDALREFLSPLKLGVCSDDLK